DELDVRVLAAAAADVGDRLHGCPKIRGQRWKYVLPDRLHHGELIALAVFERYQPHINVAEVPRLGRVARDLYQRVGDLRHAGADGRSDAVRVELGRFEARPFRRPQVDFELGLVVVVE